MTEEQFSAIVKRGPRAQSSVYEQTLKILEGASQWLEWAYYFYLIMQAQNLMPFSPLGTDVPHLPLWC